MKKLFTLLCICLCSIVLHAEVETGTCGKKLTWSYDSETQSLTIKGSGAMTNYDYYYDYGCYCGYTSAPWDAHSENILSVSLPDGLTSLGDYAFYGCSGLTSVTIPNSVTSIGEGAFYGCSGFTSITIPESVTSIGEDAFRGCTGLAYVTIPESVTSIADNAFYNVFNIAYYGTATGSPWGARNVNRYIEGYLVYESAAKTELLKCNRVATGEIVIPESVTSIGESAFSGCSGLTSVTIPESVTSIGESAFSGCSGLTSVTIPESVTSVGKSAFSGCSGLTSVTWNAKNCSIPIPYFSPISSIFADVCSQITSFTFGDKVEHVPGSLCQGMNNLISLIISKSVTSIGNSAFFGCTGLTSVTIPESVTSIGNSAFYGCTGLTSVTIPESVTSIGNYAFSDCTGLTSVTIPESVTSIEDYAFYNVLNIAYYGTATGSPWGARNVNRYTEGYLVYESAAKTQLLGCSTAATGEIVIPESVTSVGKSAFSGCSGLTSVTIPESVTSVGYAAFSGCSGLTSVTIPESVTSIGNSAFSGCTGLTSVTIPESVTSVGYAAFSGCTGLTSVTIPESVTSIGKDAFNNTPWYENQPDGVVYVNKVLYAYKGTMPANTSIVVKEGTISISSSAFYGYTRLTSVTIPESVMSIGSYAFEYCSGLTKTNYTGDIAGWCNIDFDDARSNSIYYSHNLYINDVKVKDLIIPNNVTSIGSFAFYGCTGLTSVTIPESVTSIGWSAFCGCTGLTSITCEAITPPVCKENAFYQVSANIPVYIPCGTIDKYRTVYYVWRDFTNLQEPPMPDYTVSFEKDGGLGEAQVESRTQNLDCNVTAVMSATPEFGYHFVRWNDGNTDNPRTVLLTQDTTFMVEFSLDYSGKCGDNLYWQYEDKELRITGSGAMYNYTETTQPWLLLADSIYTIYIDNTAASIGEYAFANLGKLSKLHLGAGLETVGTNAFAGCLRLGNIYSYAALPPLAEESSFANYNARLYVPCEVLGDYQLAIVFGNFKYIDCISSDGVDVPNNTVTVTPSYEDATFTWPSNGNANAYTLEITKDGVVFCTLTFNANGQLMGIAFAPSKDRNNAHAPQAAQATTNGWQFTVTGLNEGSNYAYTMTLTDNSNEVLQTYEGTFTTLGGDLPAGLTQTSEVATGIQKIISDGQVLILRNGKTYTMTGQEIR